MAECGARGEEILEKQRQGILGGAGRAEIDTGDKKTRRGDKIPRRY